MDKDWYLQTSSSHVCVCGTSVKTSTGLERYKRNCTHFNLLNKIEELQSENTKLQTIVTEQQSKIQKLESTKNFYYKKVLNFNKHIPNFKKNIRNFNNEFTHIFNLLINMYRFVINVKINI